MAGNEIRRKALKGSKRSIKSLIYKVEEKIKQAELINWPAYKQSFEADLKFLKELLRNGKN